MKAAMAEAAAKVDAAREKEAARGRIPAGVQVTDTTRVLLGSLRGIKHVAQLRHAASAPSLSRPPGFKPQGLVRVRPAPSLAGGRAAAGARQSYSQQVRDQIFATRLAIRKQIEYDMNHCAHVRVYRRAPMLKADSSIASSSGGSTTPAEEPSEGEGDDDAALRRAAAPAGPPSEPQPAPPATPAVTKRSTRHAPVLRREAPVWWKAPEYALTAADAFDTRAAAHSGRAARTSVALRMEETNLRKSTAFRDTLTEMRRNRYYTDEALVKEAPVVRAPQAKKQPPPTPAPAAAPFDPMSFWGPRVARADSNALVDTEDVRTRRFGCDWRMLLKMGIAKVIMREDGGDDDENDGSGDADGDGVPDEVEECEAALLPFHELIAAIFSFYCSLGSDMSAMGMNEWSEFISDFRIADKRSKFLKKRDLDMLFVTVDAQAALYAKRNGGGRSGGGGSGGGGRGQTLKVIGRVEFVHALIRVAIARYVRSGLLDDVSEALHKFLSVDLAPLADRAVIVDSNRFRRQRAYLEDATTVLALNEPSLRAIFDALTAACGPAMHSKKLVALPAWLQFARAIGLIGVDVSQRDATLAFAFSRMIVVDNQTLSGWLEDTCLPFESFCEALCRMAVLKALPTAQEIAEAEEEEARKDAGSFFKWLATEDEERYEAILRERGTPWGSGSDGASWGSEPLGRRLAAMLSIIFRNMEEGSQGRDNLVVTHREASSWAKTNGLAPP